MYSRLCKDLLIYEILNYYEYLFNIKIIYYKLDSKIYNFMNIFLIDEKIKKILENFKCNKLWIGGNNTISEIPENLKCKILTIWGKNTISEIPENFKCDKLDIDGDNILSIEKIDKIDFYNFKSIEICNDKLHFSYE
jgi:hypothetical protein